MSENDQPVRIFVAEDDELLVMLLEQKLTQLSYVVSCFGDGKQALDAIHMEKPDLVVLDGMLPGMDGFEVLKTLKENEGTSEIPVVMLTARGMERDIVSGLKLGAEEYIVKPFMPEELSARIKRLVDTKVKE